MKKRMLSMVLASGLALSGVFGSVPSVYAAEVSPINTNINQNEVVEIPDSALRTAIEKNLNLNPGTPITMEDMSRLYELKYVGVEGYQKIKSLEGLQYATNLTVLNINENSVSDLSPISNLLSLRTLQANYNNISDISILKHLVNLRSLFLNDDEISDISSLSNLNLLSNMSIRAQHITLPDISFGQTSYISIRDLDGSVPKLAYETPGNYSDIDNMLKWNQLGKNGVLFRSNNDAFTGEIIQNVSLYEGFESGLNDWHISRPATGDPRIQVEENGNHYLMANTGSSAFKYIHLDTYTTYKIKLDVAGSDYGASVDIINPTDMSVLDEKIFGTGSNVLESKEYTFTTGGDIKDLAIRFASRDVNGWAKFDNLQITELISNK